MVDPKVEEILEYASQIAKPFEGLILDAYFDPVGYPTQGYGHLLSRMVYGPINRNPANREELAQAKIWLANTYPRIDMHQAEEWLMQDMQKAMRSAIRLCPGAINTRQLAALTDFAFNVGGGNLEISTLRRKVNRGDFEGAANEFQKWVYARGVKLPGLVRRNAARRAMFLS